jgi:hypothetical protein
MDEIISPYTFMSAAREMEIDVVEALRCRYRFLMRRLEYWIANDDRYNLEVHSTVMELKRVQKLGEAAKMPVKKGDITDEMVEIARNTPIKSLFSDEKDWVLAWCHADKTPSVHVNSVKNVCFCNPCGKSFDPIAVLMSRDGMRFTDAVKYLAGGTAWN